MKRGTMTAAAVLAAALVTACESPLGSGGPETQVSLLGAWSLTAAQLAPVRADLAGTIEITRQEGRDFDGRLEATETDAEGRARRVGGVVTGRLLEGGTIDFDLFVGSVARRHVGTLSGVIMTGSWVESSSGGTASGSFTARRAP